MQYSYYDTAVIGGGATGAATAFELAHYNLRCVLLEAKTECGFGVSKANSGIVHGGFHYSAQDTLKGKLELRGNRLFFELAQKLDFEFYPCGILAAAFNENEMEQINKLYQCGLANGVEDIELCSRERMLELEPKLNDAVIGGLHVPHAGTVEPYSYIFALVDAAKLNGVEVRNNFEVVSIEKQDDLWTIKSAAGEIIQAKYIVNAAGLFADRVSAMAGAENFKISPRKGEEYLLDRLSPARPSKIIFPVPSAHSKGVLVIPTAGGTTMIGPTAHIVEDKNDNRTTAEKQKEIFSLASNMVSGISVRDLITSFSGSRPVIEGREDFFIAPSSKAENFIQAAGIQSPGLTASPAVAEYICNLLFANGLQAERKEEFIYPEKIPHIRKLSAEQAELLYRQNPEYANIICRCEMISEAEIRAAVRKGHTTLDGVKFAVRATMGRCQGGFCSLKIIHIIADECGCSVDEIIKNEKKSVIISGTAGDLQYETN